MRLKRPDQLNQSTIAGFFRNSLIGILAEPPGISTALLLCAKGCGIRELLVLSA